MRISRDEWGLRIAEATAELGTCLRRKVGCVLVDDHNHIIGSGYNGVPSGEPHCNEAAQKPVYGPSRLVQQWEDDPDREGKRRLVTFEIRDCTGFEDDYPNACRGAHAASGVDLHACEAVHAEINALTQCADPARIATVYTTASPCEDCIKALMNTGAKRIVFREVYPHPAARDRWLRNKKAEREWIHLPK